MAGIVAALAFIGGMVLLARYLNRRDERGYWDKRGHGSPQRPGVEFRPLEVPPRPPFDR